MKRKKTSKPASSVNEESAITRKPKFGIGAVVRVGAVQDIYVVTASQVLNDNSDVMYEIIQKKYVGKHWQPQPLRVREVEVALTDPEPEVADG